MESGIDLGFDLSALSNEEFDLDYSDFEEVIGTLKNQEYYELKSKTVPETERFVYGKLFWLNVFFKESCYTSFLNLES